MFQSSGWSDFEILDASSGERLERWGKHTLIRPDPQILWNTPRQNPLWNRADAHYHRSNTGGGKWEVKSLPGSWKIGYGSLIFNIKPMNFKHTGVFPEQAVNWEFCMDKIKKANRPVQVLNLFAYTGGATIACASAGASVCHVDAAKGMVDWAKENAKASGLSTAPIRYIVDDCKKFIEKEIRRGKKYDGVIMDPPSYGRGPGGEVWKLEESVYELIGLAASLLSENPVFFLLNSYTTGLSASVMAYLLHVSIAQNRGGSVTADELGLPVTSTGVYLPCGSTAIWQNEE